MGTGLYPTANHNIQFKNRTPEEVATEIKEKLNSCTLPNPEFLRLFALHWYGYNWERKNVREIRKINNTHHWNFYSDNVSFFSEYKEIEFYGPFELNISFSEHKIIFSNPPYKYWQWFAMNDKYALLRDEWRKYLYSITTLFGGDRVIYLADNSHPLEEFLDYEGSFETLEKAIQQKLGIPQTSFKAIDNDDDDTSYFIDDFKSINYTKSYPLDDFLPIPDDTSNTDYDLNYYSQKEHLKTIDFSEQTLLYNRINEKLHFYHLANIEGLLCEHTGIVDEEENIKITIDKYAPFIYDSLIENAEGYNKGYEKKYRITFKNKDHYYTWKKAIEEFYTELLWNGIGESEDVHYIEETIDVCYGTVAPSLSFQLLFNIAKKYHLTTPISIYKARNRKTPIINFP